MTVHAPNGSTNPHAPFEGLSIPVPAGMGTGELLGARTAAPPTAHDLDIRDGTLAIPVKVGVSASVSRTDATTRAEVNAIGPVGTDGPDGATAFRSTIKGVATCQVQICGGVFTAWQTGEANGGEGSPDACPIYAFARVTNNGIGRAIGGYIESSRETATSGGQQGLELRIKNLSGATDTYIVNGPSVSMGNWINAQSGQVAAGYQIGHGFGAVFDAGFVVNESAVKSVAFRDASNAVNSILITGEHTGGAIKLEMTAGTYDPSISYKVLGNTSSHSIAIANGNRTSKQFLCGAVKTFLSDTAVGDTGFQLDSETMTFRIGSAGKGTNFAVNQTEMGFFGKKAAQQNPAAGEAALREALKAYGILV